MERPYIQTPIPVAARSKAWEKHNRRMDWKQKQIMKYASKVTMKVMNLGVE
jgi:hypothetical protein